MKSMYEIITKMLKDLGIEGYLVVAAFLGAWLKVKNRTGTWLSKLKELLTASAISIFATPALAELFNVNSPKIIGLIAVISSYAGIALLDELKKVLFKKVKQL